MRTMKTTRDLCPGLLVLWKLLELLEWLAGTGSSMRTSSGGKQQGASRQALRLRLRLPLAAQQERHWRRP